ncbi:MAG: hypothetical protein PQJ58_14525 [Spirochaetales bacterium]|nr:hypothetical protein [Spirochaetales bacterium]
MKQKILLILLPVLLILSSCKTTEFTPETPVINKTVGDVEFTLRYVTESEIAEKHGTKANPFYRYPGKLPRKQFFVFETSIESESTELEISLRDITISLDGMAESRARSRRTLAVDWQPYITADFEESQMKAKMKKSMSSDTILVTPEESFKAWIVFLTPVSDAFVQNIFSAPKEGPSNAVIRIPAKTASGDEGIVEIPMNMGVMAGNSEESEKPVNTGIFSEDS